MCGFSALLSVLLAAAAAEAASSDLFDNQLGDISYCKKQCLLTIKNKSPAKVSYSRACLQGARGDPDKRSGASVLNPLLS